MSLSRFCRTSSLNWEPFWSSHRKLPQSPVTIGPKTAGLGANE
jgi:hypothetical protein